MRLKPQSHEKIFQSQTENKTRKKKQQKKSFRFADETELDGLVSEDENGAVSALPRRMSEVNAATKIQPIPKATSFFLFSHSNRFNFLLFFGLKLHFFGFEFYEIS
jgi:hypothetical protein